MCLAVTKTALVAKRYDELFLCHLSFVDVIIFYVLLCMIGIVVFARDGY